MLMGYSTLVNLQLLMVHMYIYIQHIYIYIYMKIYYDITSFQDHTAHFIYCTPVQYIAPPSGEWPCSKVKDVEKEVCSTISRQPGKGGHWSSATSLWMILVVDMGNVLDTVS